MIYSPWRNALHQPKEQTTTTCRLPNSSDGKGSACSSGDLGTILGQEDPQEKERATHSSILAWRLPWTGKPGELQSTGSQGAGHDWEADTHSTASVCTLHRHTLRERGRKRECMPDGSTYMKLNRETNRRWWRQDSGSLQGGGRREELTGCTGKSFGAVDMFCILIWVVKYLYIWLESNNRAWSPSWYSSPEYLTPEFLATYWLGRQDSANLPHPSLSSDMPKTGTAESELHKGLAPGSGLTVGVGVSLNSHTNTFFDPNINNAIWIQIWRLSPWIFLFFSIVYERNV